MKLHFLGTSIYPLSHFEVLGLFFSEFFGNFIYVRVSKKEEKVHLPTVFLYLVILLNLFCKYVAKKYYCLEKTLRRHPGSDEKLSWSRNLYEKKHHFFHAIFFFNNYRSLCAFFIVV